MSSFPFAIPLPAKRLGAGLSRWIATLAIGASVAGVTSGALAGPAAACSLSDHCYGIAQYPRSGVLGGKATIDPYYMSVPDGNFVTNELWLGDTGGTYWVEVGWTRNYATFQGVPQGLSIFWADSRPGGGLHNHVLETNPSGGKTVYVMQGYPSTTYGVGDGTYAGTSTNNTMTPYVVNVGSETTSAGACSKSHDYGMSYSVGNGWTLFPTANTEADYPQSVSWISYPSNMNAGVTC